MNVLGNWSENNCVGDLKRMGSEIFIRRIKAGNPDAGKNVKAYHMLRPFPQTLLDAITNKDEFLQNEGYK